MHSWKASRNKIVPFEYISPIAISILILCEHNLCDYLSLRLQTGLDVVAPGLWRHLPRLTGAEQTISRLLLACQSWQLQSFSLLLSLGSLRMGCSCTCKFALSQTHRLKINFYLHTMSCLEGWRQQIWLISFEWVKVFVLELKI